VNKTIKTVWCITFYVSDLKRAAKFYEEVLGLEKKYEFSSDIGFECGGVEIGLIPKLREGEHVAPLSPSVEFLVDDVDENILEIVQINWEKYFSVSAEGAKKRREPT